MYTKTFTTLLAASLASRTFAQEKPPPFDNKTETPIHFGFLLLPSIQPIDMMGPLDALTGLAMIYKDTTKLELSVLSVNSTPATTSPPIVNFGIAVPPTMTLDEYREMAKSNFTQLPAQHNASCPGQAPFRNKGPLDVLIVPGGGGARMDVSKEIAFVKEIYPSLKDIISVCTGSTVLARAGVLDNKKATTNKKAWAWATTFGTNVDYQTHARWVQDGNVWTGSGVSAAIDTMYAYIASKFGEEASLYVADANEYSRWEDPSYDPFADRWGVGKNTTKAA
ncbi:class I glutamine amidotransferase-like protein [Periconia macrospinosa]|uniref:Class I glutamine amidotransferase-like protein n=1 Tax=Periconia macrospinosa TaxID=97972 RepID=A0A2V1DUX5_9PLEO|nr:class I glutamine amidotransferase-like protein [Periconia macrospinosa]